MSTIVDAGEVRRTLRDIPPSDYIFKIESFSLLLETKENFESDIFEAGGYKWKLSFYPNGNKKRDGNDHISLYLTISNTNNLPCAWEVNVNFKLLVFDHIREKYLTIEDDTCVFGAEIFVMKYAGKGECLSMTKVPSDKVYTWKVDNFSTLSNECLYSEEFNIRGRNWKLLIYPRGIVKEKGKNLSLGLGLADSEEPSLKLYAKYKLMVRDQINGKHDKIDDCTWFRAESRKWVYRRFMSLSELYDKSKGFIVNDTVIIEAEIAMLTVTKNLT